MAHFTRPLLNGAFLSLGCLVSTLSLVASDAFAERCYKDGQTITVVGQADSQPLQMADRSIRDVWVLHLKTPLCVSAEYPWTQGAQYESVRQIQILGSPPPRGKDLELKGKLTTGNVTQGYLLPNAIKVIGGRLVNGEVLVTETNVQSTEQLSQERQVVAAKTKFEEATNHLSYCVLPNAQYQQLSSYDGGRSAKTLLEEMCRKEYIDFLGACEATGGESCILSAAALAQSALKKFGK